MKFRIYFILAFLSILASPAVAATATFSWDANAEPNIAGYYLYWGTSSRGSATHSEQFSYDNRIFVATSPNPTVTIGGLTFDNTIRYIAVTAVDDASGLQSNFSKEFWFVLEDLDGDGMWGRWETQNGLNPIDANDGTFDPDGDGYSNLQEFIAGLDPNIPDPIVLQMHRAGTTHTLAVPTAFGREYIVRFSDVLPADVWIEVGRVSGSGSVVSFQGVATPGFYHIQVLD